MERHMELRTEQHTGHRHSMELNENGNRRRGISEKEE